MSLGSKWRNCVENISKKQKFDLILMDMNMPVLNGYDTTARIKKLYPDNIIIAQTALLFPEIKKNLF